VVSGDLDDERARWDAVSEDLVQRFPGTIASVHEIYRAYCGDERYAAWAVDSFAGSC